MKLKLTKAEMQGLSVVVKYILTWEPKNLTQKLLYTLIETLDNKVSKKLIDKKSKYSITLDDATCIAFCLVFDNMEMDVTKFEGNLTHQLLNQFKQHYA